MSYKILDLALTRPIITTLFLFGFSALLTACASGYSCNISANTPQDTRANAPTEYSPSSADTTNSRLPDAHSEGFEHLQRFITYYNHERYHESLNNLTPADVFHGRDQEMLEQRKLIKENTMSMRRRMYYDNRDSLTNLMS